MTNTKLTHYAIRTTDLEASRRFYTEGIGFRFGLSTTTSFPRASGYIQLRTNPSSVSNTSSTSNRISWIRGCNPE